jgi:uncharacterized membrane protein
VIAMAVPHWEHIHGGLRSPEWIRRTRKLLRSPATTLGLKLVGTLVLLVLVGVVTGQLLGHLLATGIEEALGLVTADQVD